MKKLFLAATFLFAVFSLNAQSLDEIIGRLSFKLTMFKIGQV